MHILLHRNHQCTVQNVRVLCGVAIPDFGGRFSLYTFRSVAVLVCGHLDLWLLQFVTASVYSLLSLWPFQFVAIWVCGHLGYGHFGVWPLRLVTAMIHVSIDTFNEMGDLISVSGLFKKSINASCVLWWMQNSLNAHGMENCWIPLPRY